MNSQQSTKVAALSTTAIDYVFQKYNKGSEGGLLIAAVALKRGRENQLRLNSEVQAWAGMYFPSVSVISLIRRFLGCFLLSFNMLSC